MGTRRALDIRSAVAVRKPYGLTEMLDRLAGRWLCPSYPLALCRRAK